MERAKPKVWYGKPYLIKPARVGIVVSDFNEYITQKLLEGALAVFADTMNCEVEVFHVPGSFEIPVTASRILERRDVNGLLALGAIIRGETSHFEYVAGPVSQALMKLSLDYRKPIAFGILTTDSVEQALNRAGIKYGNKGRDAALSLIRLIALYQEADL
ncbi:MAG: 6,7-dimethyl-8-ribityllumazine synthase [Leptospiraceae bacterium]|nr:6,7-dimethyl-8-ribityllumazine synthase [Leptospiraceae bacterium]MDW8306861.1 6,7-dimethyl-8-ribityllumazine synthase [Leptospiraceae bacterium]